MGLTLQAGSLINRNSSLGIGEGCCCALVACGCEIPESIVVSISNVAFEFKSAGMTQDNADIILSQLQALEGSYVLDYDPSFPGSSSDGGPIAYTIYDGTAFPGNPTFNCENFLIDGLEGRVQFYCNAGSITPYAGGRLQCFMFFADAIALEALRACGIANAANTTGCVFSFLVPTNVASDSALDLCSQSRSSKTYTGVSGGVNAGTLGDACGFGWIFDLTVDVSI